MPSLLLSGALLSFTNDCTGGRSPERPLEEPLILVLEIGPDFLGLRLLIPLRPILFSLFLKSSNKRLDLYFASVKSTLESIEQFFMHRLIWLLHDRIRLLVAQGVLINYWINYHASFIDRQRCLNNLDDLLL